jgi:hypothetical protein
MSYSDFTLTKVKETFALQIDEHFGLFNQTPDLESSQLLKETLKDTIPLALGSNTEKSRSEMIIAPILIDLRRQLNYKISLFSGVDFTVAPEQGLNGICDYLISYSSELLIIYAPVIIIVEAKKENITGGLGQCIAEMIAAQIFNQQKGNLLSKIYGTVTTGSIWQFLKLEGKIVSIDLQEYYLKDVNQILGILASSIP